MVLYKRISNDTTYENHPYTKLISSYAFINYTSLTSVIMHDNVVWKSGGAFGGCSSLASIVLSGGVTYIVSSAFRECSNLSYVYYKGTSAEWENITIESNYNNSLINAPRYYYSETTPTGEGNYWHYVAGVPTIWE